MAGKCLFKAAIRAFKLSFSGSGEMAEEGGANLWAISLAGASAKFSMPSLPRCMVCHRNVLSTGLTLGYEQG
jgi:hypothetical protein